MPTKNKSDLYDNARRALTRSRFIRDRYVKTITEIQSIALSVENGDTGREAIDTRMNYVEEVVNKFRNEEVVIVDSLITLNSIDEFEVTDEPINQTLDNLYFSIKQIVSRLTTKPPESIAAPTNTSKTLPTIELPKFNGNILLWRSFRDMFMSLVHENPSISDIQRFHYLLTCVTHSALAIVKAIPLSAVNYKLAWKALWDRYENQRLLATAHVDTLFAFKPIAHESLSALNSFVNTFQENVAAIKELGVDDLAGFLLFNIASKVLDPNTRRSYEISLSSNEIPSFQSLLLFVQQRCKVLENIQGQTKFERTEKNMGKSRLPPSKSFMTTSSGTTYGVKSKPKCVFCKEPHSIYRCTAFQNATVVKRREFTRNNKLCFSCLSSSHLLNQCVSKSTCRTCHSRHHTLLHPPQTSNEDSTTSDNSQATSSIVLDETSAKFSGTLRANSTVVLGTAIVHMPDQDGVFHAVRILLDSGSQISAITSECASRLNLPVRRCYKEITGIAQHPVSVIKGTTRCKLVPHISANPTFDCDEVFVLPNITSVMPTEQLPVSVRQHYKHLTLADPAFDTPSRIDMLIGGDIFPMIVRPRADVIHCSGLPSAIDTFFGWVIVGAVSTSCSVTSMALSISAAPTLDRVLSEFWSIEEPVTSNSSTTEDQMCEEWFSKTVSYDTSGRLCVALPFRELVTSFVKTQHMCPVTTISDVEGTHGLGDSRSMALKRFYNLERKLMLNEKLYQSYRSFMDQYLSLGHMKVATKPGKYFIPHHAVVHPDTDMSKLRVVFDASASSSSGVSLNDILCTGPKLQTDIRDILLTCRLKRFMFTADIEKMYRKIRVRPSDCLYQHIFWRKSPEDELQEFELLTVTYGVNAAPYLAIRCLHELERRFGDQFPAAKGILTKSTYVDDIVAGADSEEELMIKQDHISSLLQAGGCQLKKWTSNSQAILNRVPAEHRAQLLSFDPKDDCSFKVLGLHWDTSADNFGYHTSAQHALGSKRGVLSTIARLYDPIGALGPTLLWAKVFMQELWRDKLQWDDPLPSHLLSPWEQFLSELPSIPLIALPRHVDVRNSVDIKLLGFSDASLKGYAATAYLRVTYKTGRIKVYFLATKSKVAPLKTEKLDSSLSVSRLKLCGALLLAQLLKHLSDVLEPDISISKIYAWTDSSIVLSWLSSAQKDFKVFVSNRIAKIHSILPSCQWLHVPTIENPADPSSRGLLPQALISCNLHWKGPDFLQLPESEWPLSKFIPVPLQQLPELRPVVQRSHLTEIFSDQESILQRFSSYNRMLRSLAFCIRFAHRAKKDYVQTGVITKKELDTILLIIIRITQQKYFSKLYHQIKSNTPTISPPSLAQLAPFIDPSGLIRVGGRLRFSSLNDDAKHPILLPKSSHLTRLIIQHYHLTFLHSGPKLILSMIGRKYWILSGRDAVRQFIFSCTRCTRVKAVHPKPLMADLPSPRVQPHRPFLHTGMDYGGPFVIKESRRRNAKTSKAYLALFICMSTKAVHLEVVTDLTTQSFLATLDRFVARRGIPSDIYCDNGTNYVGAARQMKNLFAESSAQDAMTTRIPCEWHFNPPASPHFGGLWEAAIKSTKNHLKHAIGQQVLTYEELQTLFTRIEGILNSRPLSPLSSDPHDLCALTPGHFLIGQPIQALPERNVTSIPMNRLERWTLLRQCHQTFWTRWAREYLTTLQGRMKWYQASSNLATGDLVIVEAPNRPPTDWRLGRITDVHPGSDGIVRVVTVRTQDGCFKRPAVKLVKLPA